MTESVAEFAERARAWLADNMPRIADPNNPPYADRGEQDSWQHVRQLQRRLHDGGFAACSLSVRCIVVVSVNRGAPCCTATGAPVFGGAGPHPAFDTVNGEHPAANPSVAPAITAKPNRPIRPLFI